MKTCLKIAVSLLCLIGQLANATLIGDEVDSYHTFPTVNNVWGTKTSATVVDGSSDAMSPYYNFYSVNVNAASIDIFFNYSVAWAGFVDFNGVTISDLDDSSGNLLQGITVETKGFQFANERSSFGSDWLALDWSNMYFHCGDSFRIDLDYSVTDVAEPASIGLVVFGLLGLGMMRRRKPAA